MEDLRFGWKPGKPLLNIPRLMLAAGQSLLLSGPSGSGKSTLLNLIGGVIPAAHGQIRVAGSDLAQLAGSQRDRFRAEHLGIIFQQFNLLPFLGVIENILLPLQFAPIRRAAAGSSPAQRRAQAEHLLHALGLERAHWTAPAYRLSVGQQQRVAAARALIGAPDLILADEPTSALDPVNRDRFIELLLGQASAGGSAVLMVSHDPALADHFWAQLALAEPESAAEAA